MRTMISIVSLLVLTVMVLGYTTFYNYKSYKDVSSQLEQQEVKNELLQKDNASLIDHNFHLSQDLMRGEVEE